MKTILVVGGGITGLTAMYELNKWKQSEEANVNLILAEAETELGGKIHTVKEHDFIMEAGADSIVARKANIMSFITELGLEEEVVYNGTGRSFIYTDGGLKSIPEESVFGIPASIESLAKSTLVSSDGKVAALKDLYTTNETFTKNDSIGDFLKHFFGEELVEKQIAPVLSGVYSGKLNDLTIASTLPYILDYKETYGSIIKGFEANKEKFKSSGEKKFLSFKNGLKTLVDTMEQQLNDVAIMKKVKAMKINKIDNQYEVTFSNNEVIKADQIILSIPHTAAEALLVDKQLKSEFTKMKNSSLISVYVGFDVPDHQLPMEGTGFITANNHELTCNACTWTSRKWQHTSKTGNLLVRMFYKSNLPSFSMLEKMEKAELLQEALADIEKSIGITSEPIVSEITKWTNNMPNYQITHPSTVATLEKELSRSYPGVFIAGCSYFGVGIPDCIENGKASAEKVIHTLLKAGQPM